MSFSDDPEWVLNKRKNKNEDYPARSQALVEKSSGPGADFLFALIRL